MIKPAEIVDALVDKLRGIDELAAELGGLPENIIAYHSRYPTEVNLFRFIHKQVPPCLVVAHRGTNGPRGAGQPSYRIEVFLKSGEDVQQDPARSYSALEELIIDGIPTGQSVPLLNGPIHVDSNGIETCFVRTWDFDYPIDEEGNEYHRGIFIFQEHGFEG